MWSKPLACSSWYECLCLSGALNCARESMLVMWFRVRPQAAQYQLDHWKDWRPGSATWVISHTSATDPQWESWTPRRGWASLVGSAPYVLSRVLAASTGMELYPTCLFPLLTPTCIFFFFAIINRNCEHNIFSSSWALLVSHWTRGWSGRNLHWTSHHAVHTYEAWMQGTDALRSCYSYITFVTTVLVSSGCCNKSTIDWMA